MKRLLVLLLSVCLALGLMTGAMAEEKGTIEAPTITTTIDADGNVTLKTSDGNSNYSVQVNVEVDGNTNYISLVWNEEQKAYVSSEYSQGKALGGEVTTVYIDGSYDNNGYKSFRWESGVLRSASDDNRTYTRTDTTETSEGYSKSEDYNEDGKLTWKNYVDGKTVRSTETWNTISEDKQVDYYNSSYNNDGVLTYENSSSKHVIRDTEKRTEDGTETTKWYDEKTGALSSSREKTGKTTYPQDGGQPIAEDTITTEFNGDGKKTVSTQVNSSVDTSKDKERTETSKEIVTRFDTETGKETSKMTTDGTEIKKEVEITRTNDDGSTWTDTRWITTSSELTAKGTESSYNKDGIKTYETTKDLKVSIKSSGKAADGQTDSKYIWDSTTGKSYNFFGDFVKTETGKTAYQNYDSETGKITYSSSEDGTAVKEVVEKTYNYSDGTSHTYPEWETKEENKEVETTNYNYDNGTLRSTNTDKYTRTVANKVRTRTGTETYTNLNDSGKTTHESSDKYTEKAEWKQTRYGYEDYVTTSREDDTTSKDYNSEGVVTQEGHEVSSTVYKTDTQEEKGTNEYKHYNDAGSYTGKNVTTYDRIRDTENWVYTKNEEKQESYNKDDILTSTNNRKSATTYNDAKTVRTTTSSSEMAQYNEYGILTVTGKGSGKDVYKLTEHKNEETGEVEWSSWDRDTRESEEKRWNKAGTLIYDSSSSYTDKEEKSDNKYYDIYGKLYSSNNWVRKYEVINDSKYQTSYHSEDSNQYGLTRVEDTAYEKGWTVKSTRTEYNNRKDGKNVKSYEYVSEPTLIKDENGNITRSLSNYSYVYYDKFGGVTETRTTKATYDKKDDATTETSTYNYYVGAAKDSELKNKRVSVNVSYGEAKNNDYKNTTTYYDWNNQVTSVYVGAKETVTDETTGNATVTITDANYDADGKTMTSGSVRVNGYDADGNAYGKYTWMDENGTHIEENKFDKTLDQEVTVLTEYNTENELLGSVTMNVQQKNQDKEVIGTADYYYNEKGQLVYQEIDIFDENGESTNVEYRDGSNKNIGYYKKDTEKGTETRRRPLLDEHNTPTGAWEDWTATLTKDKDEKGQERSYNVYTEKDYNADGNLVYDRKYDDLGNNSAKAYDDAGVLYYEEQKDTDGYGYEKQYGEKDKLSYEQKTDKTGTVTTWYDNPNYAKSKSVTNPVDVKDDQKRVTKSSEETAYYTVKGQLDRKEITTTAHSYDKDGKDTVTTTVEYRNGTDKAVVTKVTVEHPTDQNQDKTTYTTADGKEIGYTRYSGYTADSNAGKTESLVPEFNPYTGYVTSSTETVTEHKKDGSYTSKEIRRNEDGDVVSDEDYSRDADGNSTRTTQYYDNAEAHLSQKTVEVVDAEKRETKTTSELYTYEGKVRSSWDRLESYNKDKDEYTTTVNHYNKDGKLVYTEQSADAVLYYGYMNSQRFGDTIFTDAKGQEIGYRKTAADGSITQKIPRTDYSGNLSGAWSERTQNKDQTEITEKEYDEDGILTYERSVTETIQTRKDYWDGKTTLTNSIVWEDEGNGLTKTTNAYYNENGTLRRKNVNEDGRQTGTHFRTTKETYYNSKNQVVMSHEQVEDLQKNETTGVWKDAAGKEIGHDRRENEDGSWSELYPTSVWDSYTGDSKMFAYRTGEFVGVFKEYGRDKDGLWYSVSYDKNMKETYRSTETEDENGVRTTSYYADGKKTPYMTSSEGVGVSFNNKGEVLRSYSYEYHTNRYDDDDTATYSYRYDYYDADGNLTYTQLEGVQGVNRSNYTLYLDAKGNEIAVGDKTEDNGDYSDKWPSTSYTNKIVGYHENITQDDGKVYIYRNYDADNKMVSEDYRRTDTVYTDTTVTRMETDKQGRISSISIDYKDENNETVQTVTKYFTRWNGRQSGTYKYYYEDDYTARKYYDSNNNVTWYGTTWNENDYSYTQDYWINGKLQEYSWDDDFNETGSHYEYYHPDGSLSSWTDDDGNGNRKEWLYYDDGTLQSYMESTKDVTNIIYYNKDGSVKAYDWNQKDNNDEHYIWGYDVEIWDASSLKYRKHVESSPDTNGNVETWTDPAGNVKTIKTDNYKDDVVTVALKDTTNGWKKAFGDEWYYVEGGKPVTGWKQIGGAWYYFEEDGQMATHLVQDKTGSYAINGDGTWVANGWYKDADDNWFYADPTGKAATGWQQIGGTWYYFDEGWYMSQDNFGNYEWDQRTPGYMVTGAASIWDANWADKTTYFFNEDGSWDTSAGWKNDGVNWYYFDEGGNRATGWRQIGGTWYYFNDKGVMRNGWVSDGSWYYMNEDGSMAANQWVQERYEDDWYYVDGSGSLATGWQNIGGTWYYMDGSGVMADDEFVQDGPEKYYIQEGGAMAANQWIEEDGDWYYADESGKIKTGWVQMGSTWYYMDANGVMVTGDVTINGQVNHFDASGAWIGAD